MSDDLDGKIEKAMPKEDADQTPKTEPTQGPSFVKEPPKTQPAQEKRTITTLDVLMYMAKQLKEIKEDNKKTHELLERLTVKPVPVNQVQQTPSGTVSQPTLSTTQAPASPAPVDDAGMIKIKDALADFLKDGSLTVNATENTMFYIVRSTKFLGTDNFAKIAGVVRGLGGEYVSQGKASHFKVPKGTK